MIQVELPTLAKDAPIDLCYASSRYSGYGHQTITVELEYKGIKKEFSSTTNNMPDFDDATDLEGDEKKEAFYGLISYKIEERVKDWIDGIDYDEKNNEKI